MEPVNILDARNNLSQLVAAAANGEDVVIAKRGKPVVRLVPVSESGWSAGEAALWLTTHPAPSRPRSQSGLDDRISRERLGWE